MLKLLFKHDKVIETLASLEAIQAFCDHNVCIW